ncbi:MAG: SBBP repeat-containing protein, partial [Candidatus Thorarchaeota archaeon]
MKGIYTRSLNLLICGMLLTIMFGVPLTIAADAYDAMDHPDSVNDSKKMGVFLENKGQFGNPEITFVAQTPDGYIGISTTRITLWSETSNEPRIIQFDGTNCIPIGVEEVGYTTNYFLGDRGSYTNVRSFRTIYYSDILSGVDLFLSNPLQGVECELRLETKAHVSEVNELIESLCCFTDMCPDRMAESGNELVRFMLTDGSSSDFSTLQNNQLFLSMYLGGDDIDYANSITRDSEGNLYIVGETHSLDFPLVNEIKDNQVAGDAFVTKLDSSGEIIYSTYIGGDTTTLPYAVPEDSAADIAVDSDGNVYLTGNTKSDDFPKVNALYSWPENDSILRHEYGEDEGDAFVMKLNSTGNGIEFSTLFGGRAGDSGTAIAIDIDRNIYFGGHTGRSQTLPLEDPFDSDNANGLREGFIACISASGDTLLFSSYLGGGGWDQTIDIDVDSIGNIVITGYTEGGLPLTNPYQSNHGGDYDVFVIKLD